ncbi:MAG: acyl carrier protein [Akkermansia sp.]|nr:acyl carrier protein [Akkermansiaceae bacterium]MBR1997942.1 acyl carrier protein [Akkermansia sp.]
MSDITTIENQVKEIIVDQLGVDAEKVTSTAKFIEDLGADSLDTVELVMAFEERFSVEVSDEMAETLKSVEDVVNYIVAEKAKG